MFPRGPTTSTQTHTPRLKSMPRVNSHYIYPPQPPAPSIFHYKTHTQECTTHKRPLNAGLHKQIPADLDLPWACVRTLITLYCFLLQHSPGGRQGSRLCLCAHLSCLQGEMTPAFPRLQAKWCSCPPIDTLLEYNHASLDCGQQAVNREGGGR